VIHKIDPIFPWEAFVKGIEADITVRFTVTKEGRVVGASIVKSDSSGIFDDSALKAIKEWRFKPAIKDGEPTDVTIFAPLRFRFSRLEEARELLKQASQHLKADEYPQAIEAYNKLKKFSPPNPGVYNNRGTIYARWGKYKKAIRDFTKASKLSPESSRYRVNRANAYAKLTKYQKAIKDYTRAIELSPEDAGIYSKRGEAYHNSGDLPSACRDFRLACDLGDCTGLNLAFEEGLCRD